MSLLAALLPLRRPDKWQACELQCLTPSASGAPMLPSSSQGWTCDSWKGHTGTVRGEGSATVQERVIMQNGTVVTM